MTFRQPEVILHLSKARCFTLGFDDVTWQLQSVEGQGVYTPGTSRKMGELTGSNMYITQSAYYLLQNWKCSDEASNLPLPSFM
jgi:hypothetical protein